MNKWYRLEEFLNGLSDQGIDVPVINKSIHDPWETYMSPHEKKVLANWAEPDLELLRDA